MTSSSPTENVEISETPYLIDEEDLKQRLYSHNYGRKWSQMLVGSLILCSSLSFGMALGWGAPISIVHLKENLEQYSPWAVSIVPLGCCVGVLSTSYIQKTSGPKKAILLQAPFYILSWWLVLFDEVQLFFRFTLGLFGISLIFCGHTLLRHCLHYRFSKYIIEFSKCSTIAGIFLANCLGQVTSAFVLTIICAGIPTVNFLLLLILPESPVYLYGKDFEKSRKSLAWYRGEGNIHMDMMIIRRNWERNRIDENSYPMLFNKVIIKSLIIIIGVTILQTSSGYIIFLLYGVRFWNRSEVVSPLVDVILVSVSNICSRLFWSFIHGSHEWPVRICLLLSSLFVSLMLFALSCFYYAEEAESITINWVPIVIMFIFMFAHDFGLSYYPDVLANYYVPCELENLTLLIQQCAFWFCVFINTYAYGLLRPYVPNYLTFATYGLIVWTGMVFMFIFVVEAKGASLIQIQMALGGIPVGTRGQNNRWTSEITNNLNTHR